MRPGTFHEGFSAEDFVDLLFSLLLAALLRKDAPCAPILALIRRTIYWKKFPQNRGNFSNANLNIVQKGVFQMQVKKNTLLLLACLVWTAAGSTSSASACWPYATQVSLPHILLSLLVFFLFQVFVFGRLVGKHTRRILGYWEDRQFFLRFFDKKSFLLMAGMMSLGMFLRVSGLAAGPLPGRDFTLVWGRPAAGRPPLWPELRQALRAAGPDRPCQ